MEETINKMGRPKGKKDSKKRDNIGYIKRWINWRDKKVKKEQEQKELLR